MPRRLVAKSCERCQKAFQTSELKQTYCSNSCSALSRTNYRVLPGMKRCSTCGEVRPESQFSPRIRSRPTLQAGECSVCRRKRLGAWNRAHPRSKKDSGLRKRYGISLEQYEEALLEQRGLCAICHQRFRAEGRGGLSVDHDHATGRFRGLLCPGCNTSLEWFLKYRTEAESYLNKRGTLPRKS